MIYIYIDQWEKVVVGTNQKPALEAECIQEGRPVIRINTDKMLASWEDCDGKGEMYL